jgi:hypothetical protein
MCDFAVRKGILPAVYDTDGNVDSGTLDIAGFKKATLVIEAGVITDGTHQFILRESDDDATYTDVAAADLAGDTLPTLAYGGGGGGSAVYKTYYNGTKRYLQCRSVVDSATATNGGIYSSCFILTTANQEPAT